jgi:signal transduction histidine kinase
LIEQIESLAAIATAFSDFAKMPKSEMQELDLIVLISTVLATYSGNATAMKLDGDVSAPCMVLGDRKQLNRALINLITNSLQAIDSRKDGLIMIHVEHRGEKVRIYVKDNGPGIPDDQKPRIFVPNFSTKSEGMGLGLAMVKSIVEGHGGAIWFISPEGEGASFIFELPTFNEN